MPQWVDGLIGVCSAEFLRNCAMLTENVIRRELEELQDLADKCKRAGFVVPPRVDMSTQEWLDMGSALARSEYYYCIGKIETLKWVLGELHHCYGGYLLQDFLNNS